MASNVYIYDLNSQYQKDSSRLVLYNNDVISNKITNVLLTSSNAFTRLGSRMFEPTFGGNLEFFLFEPMAETVADNIKMMLYTNITKWVEEIDLKFGDIDVAADYDLECYDIALYWKNKNTSQLGETKMKVFIHSNIDIITGGV